MKKASRYRPDRRVTAVREASDGQEKTWRCTHRRARLARVLRPPHGLDDEPLSHALRLLQPRSPKAANRRGLDAAAVRRARPPASPPHDQIPRPTAPPH